MASHIAGLAPTVFNGQAANAVGRVWRLSTQFTPSQGWATFVLLMAMLLVVATSVASAGWVETPGLIGTILLAAVVGQALAKIRAPAIVLLPVGLALGLAFVLWNSSSLIEGQPFAQQVQELWSRFKLWYGAATSGGISTDHVPIGLIILAGAWIMGYAGSWFVFRRNNVWIAIVLAGVALIVNLSLLPDPSIFRFFLFTFCAMLLVVRMRVVQNHETWRRTGLNFSPAGGWLTIHAAVWISLLALIVAAAVPGKVFISSELADFWGAARTPISDVEDTFARLTAGVAARKDVSGRVFGQSLPFLGEAPLGGEVVFDAETDYPSYWLSQTYSEYTPQGWIAGETTALNVGPGTRPPRRDWVGRATIDQTIQFNVSTSDFLAGGAVGLINRDAVFETLKPQEFNVSLLDSSSDAALPPDVRQFAEALREKLGPPPNEFLAPYIAEVLPDDLRLTTINQLSDDPSTLSSIDLARREPAIPDVVAWRFDKPVTPEQSYRMVSLVSLASDDELREASLIYERFITDHYLQLPDTLPERVRALAMALTNDADTPLDKTRAVESYLRGSDFEYSIDIAPPPHGLDGVDYFLFETKKGYSSYFASAMAVLLRAVGIPSRIAAGYAPGEDIGIAEVELNAVADPHDTVPRTDSKPPGTVMQVKDSDSHGWVQVYFPNYGWIDFEPTATLPVRQRQLLSDVDSGAASDSNARPGDPLESVDKFELLEEMLGLLDVEEGEGSLAAESGSLSTELIVAIAIAAGTIAIAAGLVSRVFLSMGLSQSTPVERAYTKMSRLGAVAGIARRQHQTPAEYAGDIGNAIPGIASAAQRISWAFARDRYGGSQLPTEEQKALNEAWQHIRGMLLLRSLGRLIPRRVAAQ